MPRPKKDPELFKIIEVFLILLIFPLLIFYSIGSRWPISLRVSYYFVVTLFVFQAGLSYAHSLSAFKRKQFHELPTAEHKPLPKTTFIICAYLPNELEVIEATLLNILQRVERPNDGIEAILAYNTPHMDPIELKLRDLAYKWPELVLANAYGSRSKSENLNYALDIASGNTIVLLDADHIVSPDCLKRAWRWLDEGYDCVQGRCKIRNGHKSIVSGFVEVEFEAIYGISHYAKSRLFDSTLFGGSNGYWKSAVIKSVKFRNDRLTEDIDTTLRAILSGYHIVHDRSIISYELAPQTPKGLWYQRKRWSQGWFQCSVQYQLAVFKSRNLNFRQKFLWTTLLMWRIIYDVFGYLLFPILFAYWTYRNKIEFPMTAYIWFALIFTLLSGPFETIAAFKNAIKPRAPLLQYIAYALFHFPYTLFKNLIQAVAIRDELMGRREWIISPRMQR